MAAYRERGCSSATRGVPQLLRRCSSLAARCRDRGRRTTPAGAIIAAVSSSRSRHRRAPARRSLLIETGRRQRGARSRRIVVSEQPGQCGPLVKEQANSRDARVHGASCVHGMPRRHRARALAAVSRRFGFRPGRHAPRQHVSCGVPQCTAVGAHDVCTAAAAATGGRGSSMLRGAGRRLNWGLSRV